MVKVDAEQAAQWPDRRRKSVNQSHEEADDLGPSRSIGVLIKLWNLLRSLLLLPNVRPYQSKRSWQIKSLLHSYFPYLAILHPPPVPTGKIIHRAPPRPRHYHCLLVFVVHPGPFQMPFTDSHCYILEYPSISPLSGIKADPDTSTLPINLPPIL